MACPTTAAEICDGLRGSAPLVLPSMLLCDFGNLEREIDALERAGARALHLDVMDGHFVPNLTYGPMLVQAMRSRTELPLDVHLMISEPARYVSEFAEAGANILTIHAEAVEDPRPVLDAIRDCGVAAGLAINPGTPVASITEFVSHCDLVLAMSVEPGFGGQAFEEIALQKLAQLRDLEGSTPLLEIDGGVNRDTISACARAGAHLLVAGSAVFRADNYAARLGELSDLAQQAFH